jgi:hypothetical protein
MNKTNTHARILRRKRDRLLDVPRLQRAADSGRVIGRRLVAVLREPERDVVAAEPLVEGVAEAPEVGESHARPTHGLRGADIGARRIRVLRPGIELHLRSLLREKTCEACGRVAVLDGPATR